jgi:arsenite methyltransferase
MNPLPAQAPQPDGLRRVVRETYADAASRAATVVPGRRAPRCIPHSGLGCGSPTAFAALTPGERVLDLGSGAGFDCLAAAVEVGSRGRVVGVDMTPEMVRLARRHAADAGVPTVQFLQAEIESLPFPDASFDVVMSNCVLNLCADKARILAEACRVLAPDGRLVVSDIVAVAPLPVEIRHDIARHAGCIAGATPLEELAPLLLDAGFATVEIDVAPHSRSLFREWGSERPFEFLAAANVMARKDG